MDAQETSLFLAVLATSLVLGIVFTYFFVTLVRSHRQKQKLYKAKLQAEISTLEKERSRVAADLHDELGPLLLGVKFNINNFNNQDPEDEILIEKANNNIDNVIVRMREISRDLLPQVLYKKGLKTALIEFVDQVTTGTSLNITYELEVSAITPERSIHIFRILQEIIHNSIKHSQASNLLISIKESAETIILTTVDDGIGFQYSPDDMHFIGLGLRNLLSRIEVLGGNMYLDTKPGSGTRYLFEIPL